MSGLLVVTALRSEYAALYGRIPNAMLERCGMGPARVAQWLPRMEALTPDAVIVAGVAGGVRPGLKPGDVVVASEVRDDAGRIPLPAASPLVAELRGMGLTVHTGPMASADRTVTGRWRDELASSGALAVDMESAAIVRRLSAEPAPVPIAVVRVIVDTADAPLFSAQTLATGTRALATLRKLAPALGRWGQLAGPRTVLLAGPRSFCAGVERAIDIVERALRRYQAPVYVRRQIVHNAHVVAQLERRGAVFVEQLDEIPDGATVVFSAHGVSPEVRVEAARRGLRVVDATCPLVAKVHTEARRFAGRDNTVLFIGHADHDETEGTLGESPRIVLVQNPDEAERVEVNDPAKVSYLMQTTLAVEDAGEVVDVLRRRFPLIESPPTEDICYATTNRQQAVRAIASEADVVIVVGSQNSSNSRRLVEVAERAGTRSYLVDDAAEISPAWIHSATTVGLTAGASAPPHLVDEVIDTLRAFGPVQVIERTVTQEDIKFMLPKEVAD